MRARVFDLLESVEAYHLAVRGRNDDLILGQRINAALAEATLTLRQALGRVPAHELPSDTRLFSGRTSAGVAGPLSAIEAQDLETFSRASIATRSDALGEEDSPEEMRRVWELSSPTLRARMGAAIALSGSPLLPDSSQHLWETSSQKLRRSIWPQLFLPDGTLKPGVTGPPPSLGHYSELRHLYLQMKQSAAGMTEKRRTLQMQDLSAGVLGALKLLELEPDATSEEIVTAYRKKMKQAHPDAGGSAAEAKKYNLALEALESAGRVKR